MVVMAGVARVAAAVTVMMAGVAAAVAVMMAGVAAARLVPWGVPRPPPAPANPVIYLRVGRINAPGRVVFQVRMFLLSAPCCSALP